MAYFAQWYRQNLADGGGIASDVRRAVLYFWDTAIIRTVSYVFRWWEARNQSPDVTPRRGFHPAEFKHGATCITIFTFLASSSSRSERSQLKYI
jgi:hypothetical protein